MMHCSTPTMKLLPIIIDIPETGPSSPWPHIIRNMRPRFINDGIHPATQGNEKNPLEGGNILRKYLELLQQNVHIPTKIFTLTTIN